MTEAMTCGWDVETADSTGWVVCGKPAKAEALENLGANRLVCGVHARSARALGYDLEDLPGPDVRPGQVWQDADKRGHGRRVRVVGLVESGHRYAVVEQVSARAGYNDKPGRRTKIRLDRFRPTSTGYRLVTDVPKEG